MKPGKGFTLIELMVTVAILSILAAIALPSYRDYVTRGKIPDATSNLASKQMQLEQYFQDNRKYDEAPACANDTASSKYFDFSCSSADAAGFTLKATGKGSMVGFTFTINQNNVKTTESVPSGWTAPSPNNCWVTAKGGTC